MIEGVLFCPAQTVRIIAKKTLREFWERHTDAEQALKAWYYDVKHADWKSPSDIRNMYITASIPANNRVILIFAGTPIALWRP